MLSQSKTLKTEKQNNILLNICNKGIDFNQNFEIGDYNKVNNSNISFNTTQTITCVACKGTQIIEDENSGTNVCADCGIILNNILDNTPEWRTFRENDNDKGCERCTVHYNVLLPQSSLSAGMGMNGGHKMKMLQTWLTMPYKERSINYEFKKIHSACLKGDIPKCVEDDAKIMYKMANESKYKDGAKQGKLIVTRGANRRGVNASCLLYACMRNCITRTSNEIANLYGISDKEMNKGGKSLLKLLTYKKILLNGGGMTKPQHFIKRYGDDLHLRTKYVKYALHIAQNIEKLNISSDHTPFSIATTILLIVGELFNLPYITKKRLSAKFKISDATITKTYKLIEPFKSILLDDGIIDIVVSKINAGKEKIPDVVLQKMKEFNIIPLELAK